MKSFLKICTLLLLSLVTFTNAHAQKKTKHFRVEKIINVPADKVWAVVADDYGAIANSHPKIIASEYANGSLKGGEGAERMCYFNQKHTQYLHEKMVNFDPAKMVFTNTIRHAGKFPVDPDNTKAVYRVEDLGGGKSKISIDMNFRTKPAMMGGMMRGQFIKLMKDYFVAIEHHIKTGEKVTKDNFNIIKTKYSNDAIVSK